MKRKESQGSFADKSTKQDIGVYRNLLEARTMLESNDFVSTGLLTYAEGDIFEVEISGWQVYKLGDQLKVTMYSKVGILTFESTVIAKDTGSVMILNPPEVQRKFLEKRQHPRIDVTQVGAIHTLYEHSDHAGSPLLTPIPVNITDISLGGIGFLLLPGERELNHKMCVGIELDFGFELTTVAEVMRKNPITDGIFYGAKFLEVPSDKLVSLRAFILRMQVANYFAQKRSSRDSYQM